MLEDGFRVRPAFGLYVKLPQFSFWGVADANKATVAHKVSAKALEGEAAAKAPLVEGVVDDLAHHLLPVIFAGGADLLGRDFHELQAIGACCHLGDSMAEPKEERGACLGAPRGS